MDSHTPFLAAIRAAPDDDAPRLVYADWLTENGEEERAEFVRLQIDWPRGEFNGRLAELRRDHGDKICPGPGKFTLLLIPTYEWDGRRNLAFGQRSAHAWLLHGGTSYIEAEPVRGFVDSVTCAAADWLAHGDAILERHPVRRVRFSSQGPLGAIKLDRAGQVWVCVIPFADNREPAFAHAGTGREAIIAALAVRFGTGITFELPPESQWGLARFERLLTPTRPGDVEIVLTGDPDSPHPLGVIEVDESDAAPSRDHSRRRHGHTRLPAWLAEQRQPPRVR